MSTDRILRWIETGEHVFDTDISDCKVASNTMETETAAPEYTASIRQDEESGASTHSSDELLIGYDNDLLIPSNDQIIQSCHRGTRIWNTYVTCASQPSAYIPQECLDPYTLLQNIPPLPSNLPRQRTISGQALWYVPHPELEPEQRRRHSKDTPDDDTWNPENVYNTQKTFSLSIDKPTKCRISSRSCHNDKGPNCMAVLTLCWAYIITARFLEMQRRLIRYSSTRLTPVLSHTFKPEPGNIVLHLESASEDLVRWLCALLAPGLGWVVKGPLPPWIVHYDEDTRFDITTDISFDFQDNEQAPSSNKATELLMEFCLLRNIGPLENGMLQQPTEAFLAALALPFYNALNLQPQLPTPKFSIGTQEYPSPIYIRDYVKNLPYFMPLFICPASLGSVIWSIFWEPGIECNLVSVWFASILTVISPVIEAYDMEMLAKIFAFRRIQAGLLWRAILNLGDLKVLDMITSYLKSHEERLGGSLSAPDIDIAVWTGSYQSFLDEDISDSYSGSTTQVPRSDILRHRFNFRLGEPCYVRFGWQPFGYAIMDQIEPDLWPRLKSGCSRKYKHWVWWLRDKDGRMIAQIERGFRHDETQYTDCFPKKSHIESTQANIDVPYKIMLAPSKLATWSVMNLGAREASGDRSLEATLIAGIREHQWFADSRGI
ncbi:hypothetical protein BP6252_04961 [Coleophoma cylindrospora]|uniref:Uncharacterized protein n=1 Tax=Coleophoma cylindrospora TaxID=1849047 RepID=A0A3D8S1Z2_9HELO|nr:hypothetical protein BP6252_04961 [Coleophoma cylindrospora]